MGVLLNSIKPCFNWKASLHFPIIWSKLKADAHSLIRSLISVPGNQNSLSLLCRDSFANCTQFQRFSKENLSMQSVNCHSVNNCLNIQTAQQLPIKKIKPRGLCKQTKTACHSGPAGPSRAPQTGLFTLRQWRWRDRPTRRLRAGRTKNSSSRLPGAPEVAARSDRSRWKRAEATL